MSSKYRWHGVFHLSMAQLIHLYVSDYMPTEQSLPAVKSYVDCQRIIDRYRNRERLVGVPNYAVDKHTRLGRSLNRTIIHFVNVGAKVTNEDKDWMELSKSYLEMFITRLLKVVRGS